MSALRPVVRGLTVRGVPRQPAIFLVFFSFILLIIGLVSLIIPPIITETAAFLRNFPSIVESINPDLQQYFDVSSLAQYLPNVTTNVVSLISGLFSNFIFVLTTLFFALYFLLEEDLFPRLLGPYLTKKEIRYYEEVALHVERRLTAWFWGQFTLMTIIGLVTYTVLLSLGVRFALPLAVLAGLLEVVPNIGPLLSSIPAALIGFSDGPLRGISVLIAYFVIQQLENAFIVPFIMRRAVGVNPILTLMSLIIGGKVGGVLGVLLAIPFLIIMETVVSEVLLYYRNKNDKGEIHPEKSLGTGNHR